VILLLAACSRPAAISLPTDPVATFAEARFVAFGDAGNGKALGLAQSIAAVCAERGCDFVLYLGDTGYPDGYTSPDDPDFETHFIAPFAPVELPFFVVMGNHDYGGYRGAGNHWERLPVMQALETRSPKWRFPAPAYAFDAGGARFVGLDTNRILWGFAAEESRWIGGVVDSAPGPVVVFGHHSYRSVGRHGDAGNYDGLGRVGKLPGLRVAAGTYFARFVEEHLCGEVAVYIGAHDHDRQWLAPVCGMEVLVSGGGGETAPLDRPNDPSALFASDQPGFLYAHVTAAEIDGTFYDASGRPSFRRTAALSR
jgi:hypothetical protein